MEVSKVSDMDIVKVNFHLIVVIVSFSTTFTFSWINVNIFYIRQFSSQ